jgi:hypothetical protein
MARSGNDGCLTMMIFGIIFLLYALGQLFNGNFIPLLVFTGVAIIIKIWVSWETKEKPLYTEQYPKKEVDYQPYLFLLLIVGGFVVYICFENRNKYEEISPIESVTPTAPAIVEIDSNLIENVENEVQSDTAKYSISTTDTIISKDTLKANKLQLELGKYEVINSTGNRIYFYETSDERFKRKAYLVGKEIVDVIEISNDFGFVIFTNQQNVTSKGWIKMSYLVKIY